ncbi:hypothetical protein [Dictyobacter kobayashii]|uniref:Uncharacterized protein n=1 Tax=Dictyobacter kobayashii TaxID=2014872 RepID=A0A402AWX1_9CHLR|nr:hypothetical protein [Dictyobacter kobayashii]GCE23569.1 hypothetical protein KDK_73690 [Dictyobacter kobayashii]
MFGFKALVNRKLRIEQRTHSTEICELPEEAYRFAEDAQVGFPLHLYKMRPLALSMYKWILIMSIAGAILGIAVGFIGLFIFLYRWFIPPWESFVYYASTSIFLPWFIGLLFSGYAIALKSLYKSGLPISVLVCSKGLLVIRPKGVEVTRWNEVNYVVKFSGGRSRQIILGRSNRKSLTLGSALEDLDGLQAQIEQHIKQGIVKE